MANTNSAQRTKQYLERHGYHVGKTEMALFRFEKFKDPATGKEDSRAKFLKRRDLFGFIDMIAMDLSSIIAVQACSEWDIEPHVTMMQQSAMVRTWLMAGGTIRMYAWRKLKQKPGGKRMIWVPRIFSIKLDPPLDEINAYEHIEQHGAMTYHKFVSKAAEARKAAANANPTGSNGRASTGDVGQGE